MRVTQSMLTNNTLRYINQGYNQMARLQDQLVTGKKITRPSQDPVVAMKGMRYRTEVTEIEQFKRNMGDAHNWLETADSALDQANQVMQRIRELATQASNDSYDAAERANISKEITQLREHLQSIANTKNSNKYIFNGTNTMNPPVIDMEEMMYLPEDLLNGTIDPEEADIVYNGQIYRYVGEVGGEQIYQDVRQTEPAFGDPQFEEGAFRLTVDGNGTVRHIRPNPTDGGDPTVSKTLRANDVVVANRQAVSFNTQNIDIELTKGVKIPVNVNPGEVFNNAIFGDIIRLERALQDESVTGDELTSYIDNMFGHVDTIVSVQAEVGARVNRLEMMENRMLDQEITAKRIMSDNEDADIEMVIMELMMQENVHMAALASGSRIIQRSLVDFLR
ncbi:flagellar hook-associated protein FlgL [Halalkalibacter hemicellulosilyticus]|uniref:Flagellar hook-associated protein FlgL n=1 Tax=Halalkalibacter hemicellulosilyticusJCM 9152 TaxID=1236971 RepID=W4QJN2_9BACI|nr:flagellar hook-associated protein FlgL [Halalkalibacter hemicellulosilyticus]GAE32122.1 flagellar hook-associated protein FlgL [Halalkalibacter hemicellulosilyticusJCM 9152]